MPKLDLVISSPAGTFLVLATAAYLEVQGDACFQAGLHHSFGAKRIAWFTTGAAVLVGYSLFLNASRIDFGRLLGMYVTLFFFIGQLVAKLQFNQSPSRPVYVGGVFISIGGLIMAFWKP